MNDKLATIAAGLSVFGVAVFCGAIAALVIGGRL